MRTISTLEIDPLRFASDSEIALPVMVSSHERSGTHFVINSIANNSAFRNDPHLNYDTTPLGSFHNFHDSQAVLSFFGYLCEQKCASVIKSHFSPGFFLDDSGKLLLSGLCKTIYIARNPLEAMISYHRFVNYFPWYEGPRAKRPIDFLKAAPEGRMLRYQSMQVDTILERWAFHFLSWLAIAAANPNDVLVVNYKDLDRDHAAETKKISRLHRLRMSKDRDTARSLRAHRARAGSAPRVRRRARRDPQSGHRQDRRLRARQPILSGALCGTGRITVSRDQLANLKCMMSPSWTT